MKTTTLLTILTTALLLSCGARAASTPWIGSLPANGGAVTIPAGKILVIEQMSWTAAVNARFTITGNAAGGVGSGSFSVDIMIPVGATPEKLSAPIRLGPNMTITNTSSGAIIAVFGTVIDLPDFIAAANPVVKDVSVEGGQLAALVDSRTSSPTKTTGETSYDLQTWTTAGVSVAKSSSNPRVSKVITPADAPRKFVRAKVTR